MSDPDLTVDFGFLAECERKLSKLKRDFEGIETRRDDMREHWGSGDIADAMADFVDNWDDYRTRLVEAIEGVGKLVNGSKESFKKLDGELAKATDGKQK